MCILMWNITPITATKEENFDLLCSSNFCLLSLFLDGTLMVNAMLNWIGK